MRCLKIGGLVWGECGLVAFPPSDIAFMGQVFKVNMDVRVLDGGTRIVRFQVSFRNISLYIAAVHQDMIPGLFFWREGARNLVVPLIRAVKLGVHIDNYAPVVKHAMVDELADRVFCFCGGHGGGFPSVSFGGPDGCYYKCIGSAMSKSGVGFLTHRPARVRLNE